MDDGSRRYANDAILHIRALGYGFADGRADDGTPFGLRKLESGKWQAHLASVDVWTPEADWRVAAEHLEHELAGRGLWMRIQG